MIIKLRFRIILKFPNDFNFKAPDISKLKKLKLLEIVVKYLFFTYKKMLLVLTYRHLR